MTVAAWPKQCSPDAKYMVDGKEAYADVQRIVVWLSALLSEEDISICTGYHRRLAVEEILLRTIPDDERNEEFINMKISM